MKGTTRKYNKILKGDNEGTKTIRKSLETENEQANLNIYIYNLKHLEKKGKLFEVKNK